MTDDHIVSCLSAICDPGMSSNPVAWFDLEQRGFTREALKEASEAKGWIGPKPVFSNAPDRDSPMWQHMLASRVA